MDAVVPRSELSAGQEELVSGLLGATRALVAMAARTLITLDEDVSVVQLRAMMILASRGPARTADLAAEFGVASSTITRMCDRLHRKGLIRRYRRRSDRRATWIGLTVAGRELIGTIISQRRARLTELVAKMDVADPGAIGAVLHEFVAVSGEVAEPEWWINWRHSADPDPDQAAG